ncbi:restriction endonuclease [Spirosoma aerophilum]
MSIWLVRSGRSGEFENKFLVDNKIYLTWDNLKIDLTAIKDWPHLSKSLSERYGTEQPRKIGNWAGQIWAFSKEIKIGDWIALPSKFKPTIHFGEVKETYQFNLANENPFYHFIKVDWFATDIPRTSIDQDILYSLGAFLTVCKISRNDAESRLKALRTNNWHRKNVPLSTVIQADDTKTNDAEEYHEFEETAYDQIAKHIGRKFKGHNMARLIESILIAKGYKVFRSSEGPDKGIDLLAAPEPLGFGNPKICVQVKTTDLQVDRPTLDQLVGVMSNVKADFGILVSWSGFKTSVYKEIPNQFFKVRLWDSKILLQELFSVYDKLDEEIKSEIPLKKIWTLTLPDSN